MHAWYFEFRRGADSDFSVWKTQRSTGIYDTSIHARRTTCYELSANSVCLPALSRSDRHALCFAALHGADCAAVLCLCIPHSSPDVLYRRYRVIPWCYVEQSTNSTAGRSNRIQIWRGNVWGYYIAPVLLAPSSGILHMPPLIFTEDLQ